MRQINCFPEFPHLDCPCNTLRIYKVQTNNIDRAAHFLSARYFPPLRTFHLAHDLKT